MGCRLRVASSVQRRAAQKVAGELEPCSESGRRSALGSGPPSRSARRLRSATLSWSGWLSRSLPRGAPRRALVQTGSRATYRAASEPTGPCPSSRIALPPRARSRAETTEATDRRDAEACQPVPANPRSGARLGPRALARLDLATTHRRAEGPDRPRPAASFPRGQSRRAALARGRVAAAAGGRAPHAVLPWASAPPPGGPRSPWSPLHAHRARPSPRTAAPARTALSAGASPPPARSPFRSRAPFPRGRAQPG